MKMPGGLFRLIAGRTSSDAPVDPRLSAFARGLTLGVVAGAVIAGSTLWGRRSRGRRA
jgi:hypothetical protein